jgi:SAM-dependent methyltransferase
VSPTFEKPDPADDLQRLLLTYGPFFLAPSLWAYATYPDRLKWTSGLFARIFGLAAAFYDQWTNIPGYGDTVEEALSEITTEPVSILDLATGTGFVARMLKEAFPQANVTGVDVAPEMVAIAQHEAVAHDLDIKFRLGDNSELPFEEESFDLVVMQNAFPFLAEMTRVLKPGGSALIVWSFGGPWVAAAWPAMAKRLEEEGAAKTIGRRAGFGFYGMAVKEPPPLVASMRSK